jgi:hypothetical protein
MCYLVREESLSMQQPGDVAPRPGPDRVRPRWAGALAMTLAGGLALAALVAPSRTSTTDSLKLQPRESATSVAARSTAVPAAGGIERTALPVDDGVPSSPVPDTAAAGFGPCHHGL